MSEPALKPPPGPRGQRFRNLRARMSDAVGFMDRLHAEYGAVASFDLPGMKACCVFDADLLDEVVRREDDFPLWGAPSAYGFLESSISLSRGPDHERRRRLMEAAFAGERMRLCAEIAVDRARFMCERFNPGQMIDMQAAFEDFVLRALIDRILGRGVNVSPDVPNDVLKCFEADFKLSMLPFGRLLARLPTPANTRAHRAIRALEDAIYRAMRTAREPSHPGEDLVSHMVRAAGEGIVDWSWQSDREIRDEAFAVLYAFPDAPVGALVFGLYYLARNPEARGRLESEVDAALEGRPLAAADLKRLPYARAVCRETLRLASPAYALLPRRTSRDAALGGYGLARGTLVIGGLRVVHRRERYWEAPLEFRPERWLDGAGTVRSGCPAHGQAYAPFGYGDRMCPWAGFSEQLFVAVCASVAQRFRLTPAGSAWPTVSSLRVGVQHPVPVAVAVRPPSPRP